MKHEVFILGGQRIDQKSTLRKGAIVFFKSSGYDKLELKHKNLFFFQAYRMHY